MSRPAGAPADPCRRAGEAGFTLVELLVVLVILPMIVAAIAAAVITTENSTGATEVRLADSQNAQIASTYFGRDVQGAQFVTTDAGLGAPYSALSPEVCGSGTTLLVGLYRPATASAGLAVGYWATVVGTTPEVVRDACSVSPTFATTVTSTVVISDDVSAAGAATVAPAQFGAAAGLGWAPTSAVTAVVGTSPLSPATAVLDVGSTLGFLIGPSNPLTVLSSGGLQTITCLGATATSFTGCAGFTDTSGTAAAGATVAQAARVSAVGISLSQPAGSDTFSLSATPRAWASETTDAGLVGPPALLTTGSGASVDGSATLVVQGIIGLGDGTLACTGSPTVTAFGFVAAGGAGAIGCGTGGPVSTTAPAPDPLAPYLPAYPSPAFSQQSLDPGRTPEGACTPGEYTTVPDCTTLEPGVYVLDAGLDVGSGGLGMAADAGAGQGVLLYLPCDPPHATTQCGEGITVAPGATLSLLPLSTSQAVDWLSSTALAGTLVWQDHGDATAATVGAVPAASAGTWYLPAAAVRFQGGAATVGRVIAARVELSSGAALTVTGP